MDDVDFDIIEALGDPAETPLELDIKDVLVRPEPKAPTIAGTTITFVRMGLVEKRAMKDPPVNLGQCDRCRKQDVTCDGNAPCGYCTVGHFDCERSSKKAKTKALPLELGAKLNFGKLSGLAVVELEAPRCDNCRVGHRKCDRQFPCDQCSKRGIECIPPSLLNGSMDDHSNETLDSAKSEAQTRDAEYEAPDSYELADSSLDLPCRNCRTLHRRCDRKLPCSSCVVRHVVCSFAEGITK